MDIWDYYDGDLKYPNLGNFSYEKEIAKSNLRWTFEYLKELKENGKDKELEKIIAKDLYYAYQYAAFIKQRFKLGEPTIAKDAYYSYQYAFFVLKKPFPLGEPEIAKERNFAKAYTQNVLKKDFYLDGKLICKYEG